ncbi:MAG TPA: hypothetical protein VLV83_26430 [Acidobacteriota bacterium]|nr:hypothetical protein [Acidobacteriota bacterium]
MSGRIFIDTNVLVYALDEKSPRRRKIATKLLLKTVTSGKYSVSTQVLQ